jgi:hypothetical protein
MQEADPLGFELRRDDIDACDVSPRPVVTLNEAGLHGIAHRKDDRDCRGCRLGCQSRGFAAHRREHAHRLADQIRSESRQPLVIAARPAVLDRQILALDEVHLGKALPKASHLGRRIFG